MFEKLNKSLKEELLKLINEFQPDVIVSTHIAGRLFVQKYQELFVKPVQNYFKVGDITI